MDIVPLKSSHLQIKRTKRDAVRRHTTEVSFEQLRGRALSELERDTITSLSTENLSGESYNDDGVHSDESKLSSEQPSLNSSWNSLCNGRGAFDTPESDSNSYYVGSQEDVYKELNEVPKKSHLDVSNRHQYQLSYELALDNMLTPFISDTPIISPLASSATAKSKSKIHSLNPRHVIDEMVTTEQSYIRDLTDVIDGYFVPFTRKLGVLPIQQRDIDDLFGNISEIRDFHLSFLGYLLEGGHYPGKIATCFLQQAEGFKIYTQYCNNYPRSVRKFKEISKDPDISTFLKGCQLRLHHMLPLDTFLLKPVQRVLKYSPLLYEMGKRTQTDSSSYEVVQNALQKMTDVAKHINAMKRKYDMAVHVEQIQSLIRGDWIGLDLTKYGDLVLEANLRYAHYSGRNARFRTERYVFLFQRLCLITKKEEDDYYYLKAHIEMADLQLTERVEKLPRCFQLRQVSTGKSHTFMTTSQQSKEMWVRSIKLLLVESIPHLPAKARQLIMQGFDITPDHSPKRERHVRHFSEEPKTLHTISHRSREIRQDAQSMGPFSSKGSDKVFKPKMRSSTLPTTGRGSLMSMMASSVHISRLIVGEDIVTVPEDLQTQTTSTGEKRNETFLETCSNGDVTRHPEAAGMMEAVNNDTQRTNSDIRTPHPSHHSSLSSPQLSMANNMSDSVNSPTLRGAEGVSKLDIYSHSEHKLDMHEDPYTSNQVKGEHTNSRSDRFSLPNIVVNNGECHNQLRAEGNVAMPPSTLCINQPPPSVEIEIVSDEIGTDTNSKTKRTFTNEEETFFDELMSGNSSLLTNYNGASESGGSLAVVGEEISDDLPHSLSMTHDNNNHSETTYQYNEGNDDNVTPLASPHTSPSTIRRWSVKKRNTVPRNTDEDTLPTPTASPYVKRLLSSPTTPGDDLSSTLIDPPTPFRYLSPEPDIAQTFSNSLSAFTPRKGKTHIVRRHSFGYDMKRVAVHHRQESHSTEATPQSTPIMKRSEATAKEQTSSSHSGIINHDEFTYGRDTGEVMHLQLNAGNTASPQPSLKDVPTSKVEPLFENELSPNEKQNGVVLPPPVEFMDRPLICEPPHIQHHEIPCIDYQLLSSLDTLPSTTTNIQDQNSASHITTIESSTASKDQITPYESNPEEMMFFDEVLASLDDYAITTGKTTKSNKPLVKLRSQSPEAKRRKQKKKKRSQTVASIDTDTMNQVKEELSRRSQGKRPVPQQKSDSKVHQLAREYSRKIKDHQRSRIFKRYSTVVEEPSLPNVSKTERTEPEWLQQLRERKKSFSTQGEATSSVLTSTKMHSQFTSEEESTLSGSQRVKSRSKVKDPSDLEEDQQRKGGFKGWVRSLVDKISTSGNVKDK